MICMSCIGLRKISQIWNQSDDVHSLDDCSHMDMETKLTCCLVETPGPNKAFASLTVIAFNCCTRKNLEGSLSGEEVLMSLLNESEAKLHVKSYCCLDYAQVCDVLRYRLRLMRKKFDDKLTADSRDMVQQYACPGCGRRYSAFDALRLVTDKGFSYESSAGGAGAWAASISSPAVP